MKKGIDHQREASLTDSIPHAEQQPFNMPDQTKQRSQPPHMTSSDIQKEVSQGSRPSGSSPGQNLTSNYDVPNSYVKLDELSPPPLIQNHDEDSVYRYAILEDYKEGGRGYHRVDVNRLLQESDASLLNTKRKQPSGSRSPARPTNQDSSRGYDFPDSFANLDEVVSPPPIQNPNENLVLDHESLETSRREELEYGRNEARQAPKDETDKDQEEKVSRFATQLYTISYLIFFAILGTLARLGLQGLTFYPGAPVVFSELWANFGGSLIMGFLSEDRMLFREEWGTHTYGNHTKNVRKRYQDEESGTLGAGETVDLAAAKKAHTTTKRTIPLYIGLATGFCGSFTSFSSFIRDAFLALSNDLPTPLDHPSSSTLTSTVSTVPRNDGYSLMAVIAVVIITVTVSLSGLSVGAHLAILLEPYIPSLPFSITRKLIDPLAVFLAWSCWLGAIFLASWPPDRHSALSEIWRGRAVFALVFAPLGCLGRFYASLYLNGRSPSFPLGTFAVNVTGTMILGMTWDLQHVPLGGVIGCQVLQGVEDGFCGCLTTVSTWVNELSTLRRSHAYKYGAASVFVGLCTLVVIMGGLGWTNGFSAILCLH